MVNNAHDTAKKEGHEARKRRAVIGTVEQVWQKEHVVAVNIRGEEADLNAPVQVQKVGDQNLPAVGEHVIVNYDKNGNPYVGGSVYLEGDTAPNSGSAGDRIVSNSSSNSSLQISEGGDVAITAASADSQASTDGGDVGGGENIGVTTEGTAYLSGGTNDVQNVSVGNNGRVRITNDSGEVANIDCKEDGSVVINNSDLDGQITIGPSGEIEINTHTLVLSRNGVEPKPVAREGDPIDLRFGGKGSTVGGGSDVVKSS